VLASIALILALTGAAIAGPQVISRAITKAKVKSISKRQANVQITRRAPGLAVASAKGSETAQTAESANPTAFAHVAADGTVDAANSKGLAQANLINTGPVVGYYCFGNLPFVPRGGNATVDWNGSGSFDAIATVGLGGNPLCPAGTQLFVDTRNTDSTGSIPAGFFLTLYR
jgi:hypothetical protein